MMFEVKKPGKKIKSICSELGSDYTIRLFDLENVIYRDLGNGYDLEVSQLDNARKAFNATLYIWRIANPGSPYVVETIRDIQSIEELKSVLATAADKYRSLK